MARLNRELYLMGRELAEPLTEALEVNVAVLLYRVNALLQVYGSVPAITSGYRPPKANAAAGGSLRSAHITCQAVDLADPGGALAAFILADPALLARHDLYIEDPAATKGWCHLQTRPTASGRRVFKP